MGLCTRSPIYVQPLGHLLSLPGFLLLWPVMGNGLCDFSVDLARRASLNNPTVISGISPLPNTSAKQEPFSRLLWLRGGFREYLFESVASQCLYQNHVFQEIVHKRPISVLSSPSILLVKRQGVSSPWTGAVWNTSAEREF